MKRTISLFLSAVMVLSCFFGLSFDAFAETLKNMGTISLDETKTIEIDDEDEIAYYTFTPSETGTYRYYSLADDTVDPKGYIYEGEDVIAENDDSDDAGYNNFCIVTELTAGVTYKLAGNCWNNETGSYDVTIEESPYKSISVTLAEPIQIIENSDGMWDTDNNGNDFFYYEYTIYREGASITVTKSDDSTVVYTYDGDEFVNSEGEELSFDYYSDQYNKPWTIGENNFFTVEAFGLTTQVPVEIIKKPYKSVSVTLAKPIQIIENSDGEWDTDEDNNDYFCYQHYSNEIYREGNSITLTTNDDSTVVYTYDEDECTFINSEGDELDFYCSSDQYENHWTVGNTNYFTLKAYDCTTQVPVEIIKNPYKSISVTLAEPIQILENSDGYWDVDEDDNDYYYYQYYSIGLNRDGNSITVTKNDNSTVVYTYDEDEYAFVNSEGEELDVYCDDDQYENHWALGENNFFTVGAFGLTTQVPVEIVTNPYKSISVSLANPIKIVENSYGDWEEDEDGNNYFYYEYYSDELEKDGNSITVTKNDNSTVVYRYNWDSGSFENNEGDELDFYCYDDQEENHWTLSKNNYFTVGAFGLTAQVPVEIIENPVESIQFIPVEPYEIFEHSNGWWSTRFNDDGEEEEYYYYNSGYSPFKPGNKIIVNYNTGEKETYICDNEEWEFYNNNGRYLNDDEIDYDGYSQEYTPWEKGKENFFTLTVFGVDTQVPVSIVTNPYKSISVNLAKPIQLIENRDGEWDVDDNDNDFFYYYGYSIRGDGNTVTLTKKDNTKEVYTFDGDDFVNNKGEILDFDYESNQYDNHWMRGKNNSFTVEAFGCTTQVPVEIIENPVASISFVLSSPIQLIENVDGYTEYDDETGESYFCYYYSLYKEGNKLIIKYKNGKTETCSYVKSVGDFVNSDGEEIYFSDYDHQYSKPWTLGKNNYITVEYMDAETQVPVEIVKNSVKAISYTPAKPIRVMENTFGWMEEDEYGNDYFDYGIYDYTYEKGAVLTITYTDNSTEKFVCNGDDFISQKTNKALKQYVDADDDQYENHWGVGTNYFTVSCYGKEAQVPVEVYAGNIVSAEYLPVKPAKILENTKGYYTYDNNDQRYFKYYTPYFNKGDIVRFTLGDGTKVDFVCVNTDEEATFYSEYFGRYWWFYSYSDQEDNHWTLGENTYYVEAFGTNNEATVEIISAEGHEHNWEEIVVKPTCCDKGYTYKRCDECGEKSEPYNYTDKTAHTYDSGTVLKAATATEEGKILYVCTWCGHKKTVTAPKLTPNTPITLTTPSIKKLKKGKKRFTAFWDKIPGVTRYEIQYSRNKKFKKGKKYGTKIKKVSADKSKITIKKLKKGKRYYVRIRAVKGTQVSPWSKTKKIKVK